MDWHSEEGKALLRQAYPDGWLPVRGVFTLGNYLCLEPPDEQGGPLFFSLGTRMGEIEVVEELHLTETRFLPMPNLSDGATWVALLSDLAAALYIPNRPDEPNSGYCWQQVGDLLEGEPPCWRLTVASTFGWTNRQLYGIPTGDSAEALIRARARMRSLEKEPV